MTRSPLEARTTAFSRDVRLFLRKMPNNFLLQNDCKQLWKSSGSVGANFLEAIEAVSKPDFLHRIRIARKEAKESMYWLELMHGNIPEFLEETRETLHGECKEISTILTSIAKTTQERYRLA